MDLRGIDFGPNTSGSRTELQGSILRGANLSRASFIKADLNDVDLSGADLSYADLSLAGLSRANLSGADLTGTNFFETRLGRCQLANVDLIHSLNIDQIIHTGPSSLGIDTLKLSQGKLPALFLRGCGLEDWEVELAGLYAPDLSPKQVTDITYKVVERRGPNLIQFYSCFISYSNKDKEFVDKFYGDLQARGVRCWYAPRDMKIGDRIRSRIDESILLHDKVLLVLSKASVTSQWIEQEVATALRKEREQGCDVLFPIQLDNSTEDVRGDWPAFIKNTRHIGDFNRWKEHDEYQKALNRLLGDLKVGD